MSKWEMVRQAEKKQRRMKLASVYRVFIYILCTAQLHDRRDKLFWCFVLQKKSIS